jgi:transposase InsO family protein
MSDDALLDAIRGVLAESPFHGEGHRKVWARLRVGGVRTSKRRVLRLMRENALLAPSRVGSARGPRSHDGTIIPDTVNEMWGTDLTTTITGEGHAAVFIAIDHFTAECVGIHADRQATRFQASSQSDRTCGNGLRPLQTVSRAGSVCGTITDRSTCPTRSRANCAFSVSRARLPSFAPQRATAALNVSSER